MAINETVRDIENNPSKTKTISLDLQKVVPLDNQGDEVYVLNSSSTAIKQGGGTSLPVFVREFKVGYCQSSSFKNPPFTITNLTNTLKVSVDGSIFRVITLTEGTGLTGENVADDLQTKINALAGSAQSEQFNLAFLNATVEFVNNRFRILSGSISNTYTGVGKTSVNVVAGDTNNATAILGFDKNVDSEAISSKRATETIVSAGYTAGAGTLTVDSTAGFAGAEAFTIFDGTNREYFISVSANANSIVLSGSLANSYATGSVVQKIFERDPISQLASPYDNIDAITRFSLRSIANQLDFTV